MDNELFNISTEPLNGSHEIYYDKDISLLSEEEDEPNESKSMSCWNCGGNHKLSDCTLEISQERIRSRRIKFQKFSEFKRYHIEGETLQKKYPNAEPGIISEKLRAALGIMENQLPRHVYKMRIFGYPPGWLEQLKVTNSGINMLDSNGDRIPDEDEEEGEIVVKQIKYDLNNIIDYPGFNVWPTVDTLNETEELDVPPMCIENSKGEFIKRLQKTMELDNTYNDKINNNEKNCFNKLFKKIFPENKEKVKECKTTQSQETVNDQTSDNTAKKRKKKKKNKKVAETSALHIEGTTETEQHIVKKMKTEENLTVSPGNIVSIESGTPTLKLHSSFTKLPSLDSFSKNISDVVHFENLPNTTGNYNKLKDILKSVRSKLFPSKSSNS